LRWRAAPLRIPRPASGATSWPVTGLHYAPNGNWGSSGHYLPGADGINLADVGVAAKGVYQTFGGGGYYDDADGQWVLPTAAQERQILADWAAVIPHPAFDYAYSWGSQNGDMALDQSPALQDVFAGKNARSYRSGPDADPSFTDRGRCCGPRAGSSR
jgi:hypothetical protein